MSAARRILLAALMALPVSLIAYCLFVINSTPAQCEEIGGEMTPAQVGEVCMFKRNGK